MRPVCASDPRVSLGQAAASAATGMILKVLYLSEEECTTDGAGGAAMDTWGIYMSPDVEGMSCGNSPPARRALGDDLDQL